MIKYEKTTRKNIMKEIYPLYLKEFECIAGNCPDTCCAGWEIVVDEKFQQIYKQSKSKAAKKAVEAMYRDSDGDVCLRLNNGRCPMLNKENLCELYIDIGKDALCDVCRVYPRFNKEFEDFVFSGISLSCPEAARLILEDDSYGELNYFAEFVNEASEAIFKIFLFMKDMAIKNSFFNIADLAEELQFELDFGDTEQALEIIGSYSQTSSIPCPEDVLEIAKRICDSQILTDEWKVLSKSLVSHLEKAMADCDYRQKRDKAFFDCAGHKEIKNTEIYYLYKYLPEALEGVDIASTAITALGASSVICELYAMELIEKGELSFERKLRLAQLFSKEIEHNEENIKTVL